MDALIDKIIISLCSKFNKQFDDFSAIYLFGDYAVGEISEDSEVELVAIFKENSKDNHEILWKLVGEVEEEFDVYINLYPITRQELKQDEYLYDSVKQGFNYDKNGNITF